jgi:hypothetical protein
LSPARRDRELIAKLGLTMGDQPSDWGADNPPPLKAELREPTRVSAPAIITKKEARIEFKNDGHVLTIYNKGKQSYSVRFLNARGQKLLERRSFGARLLIKKDLLPKGIALIELTGPQGTKTIIPRALY